MKPVVVAVLCLFASGCASDVDKCVSAGMRVWREHDIEERERLAGVRLDGPRFTFLIDGAVVVQGKSFRYTIRDNRTNRQLTFTGPGRPSEQELEQTFASRPPPVKPKSEAEEEASLRMRCGRASRAS
ncbi:MAG: hypothetical protein JW395_2612 [Nitrospira sp.]|nr:hypothetical protein [Nitrospira sp.]